MTRLPDLVTVLGKLVWLDWVSVAEFETSPEVESWSCVDDDSTEEELFWYAFKRGDWSITGFNLSIDTVDFPEGN